MNAAPRCSFGLVPRVAPFVGAAALALLDAATALAQGCAMCRTALDDPNDPLAQAFNVSILFLMAMPYLIVGTAACWIYLATQRRRGTEAGEAHAPEPQS